MSDYPHTIDNGAGEKLTFLGLRSDGPFPVVAAIGRLFGLDRRRFAGAPEPVSGR